MPDFKNLNDLFKYMEQNIIPDVIADDVHEVISQEMSEKVDTVVYDSYTPSVYQRRGSYGGGLADTRNVIGTFHHTAQGVEYLIQNITQGRDGGYIAGLVEYGHDNGYGTYDYPYSSVQDPTFLESRPFISETVESLRRNLRHVEAMRSGLNKRGIKTE